MTKKMVCIECPKSCLISVDIENCKVAKVTGAKCPRGVKYALAEAVTPARLFTATVIAEGLDLKLIPVRTDKPIPKKDIFRAVEEIRKLRIEKPVKAGETIVENFLGLGIKLLATREAVKGGCKNV
ncbi:MAG: DUF1667 domain-containing protein [Candidatus Omnitrophica bacterium]|nr:DUF1667 domain-containing protein [Candidatus Omnitrophota bacterium]